MTSRLHHLRAAGCAAGAIFLAAAGGCAFPHGSTGGDPVLGNFHRPIVPSPPPERGGIGLDSPAYDGGSRIGVAVPEAPAPADGGTGNMSLPSLTSPNLLSGAKLPFQAGDDSTVARKPAGGFGAKLPTSDPTARPAGLPGGYAPRGPEGVTARPRDPVSGLTSPAAFTPTDPPAPAIQPVGYTTAPPRSLARVRTVEEAQEALRMAGAEGQRTEQLSGGEWLFACTTGSKVFEARGADPLEAMRKVLAQVQK